MKKKSNPGMVNIPVRLEVITTPGRQISSG